MFNKIGFYRYLLIKTKTKQYNNFKKFFSVLDDKSDTKESLSPQDTKINTFYEFMEENIKKVVIPNNCALDSKTENDSNIDDIKYLLDVIKCPITDSNLEECEEGLKVSHIIYPKRDGMFILREEDAQFKF
jgi:hypothetical protein